ncbi:MAG: chemotaxis protein CheR [Burkholderiales bacterium]|nr:chemotaxis protein CheR [Burkholderiales bacterium]
MSGNASRKRKSDANWEAQPKREFVYAWDDFERARRMIRAKAGVTLADHKHHLVYSRLSKRLRQLGKRTVCEYLDMLEADPLHPEWHDFTSSLTTHLTSFFREPHHFDLLAHYLQAHRGRPIRIWSSAASTGEEPYSIAMTVAECYKTGQHTVTIYASDIDERALGVASVGIYPAARVERMAQGRLKRFFLQGTGDNTGLVRLRPEIRQNMHFFPLNLQHAHWPVEGKFDVIFCRNVMIYFEREDQTKLIERLLSKLAPGGLLFLGHSENAQCVGKRLTLIGKTAYQLVERVAARREGVQ